MKNYRLQLLILTILLVASAAGAQQTPDHTLTLYIPGNLSENDHVLEDRGWVRIPKPAESDLKIDLATDDTTEIIVPPFVYIREGDNSVYFDVTVVDDNSIDGRQRAQITATSPLWAVSTSSEVYIDDNETQNSGRERFIGDIEKFQMKNFHDNTYYETSGTLAAKGKYCYFWLEEGRVLSDEAFKQMVYQFDYVIYPKARMNFGSEVSPGIDNELRIHIFLLDIKDSYDSSKANSTYVSSHYDPIDEYSTHFYPYSNEKEIIYVDVNEIVPLSREFYRAICYQFTKMIIYNKDTYEHPNHPGHEEVWVQDGLANLSCFLTGYGHPQQEIAAFLKKTNTRLVQTNLKYYTRENAGLSYLFFLYLYEKYGGTDFTRQFTEIPENGVNGINSYIGGYAVDFNLLLEFFYSAIILDDLDAGFAYYFENIDLEEPVYFSEHLLYPVREKKGTVEWSGVRYIAFKGFFDNKFYLYVNDLTKSKTLRARVLLKKGKKQSWQEIVNFDYSGYAAFIKQRMGTDYDYAVLMLTNIGEFSDGDYEYSAKISGPLIVPFFNPVFPDELFINVVSSSEPEIKIEQSGWSGFKYLVLNQFKPYHFTANYHIDKDFVGTGEVTAIGSSPEGEFGEVHWFFHVKRFLPYWDPYDSGNWQILTKIPQNMSGRYAVVEKDDNSENILDSITLHSFANARSSGQFRLKYDLSTAAGTYRRDKVRIVQKYGDYIKVISQKPENELLVSEEVLPGDYFVMHDSIPPSIRETSFREDDFIEVEISDEGSGIKGIVVSGAGEYEKTVNGNSITVKVPRATAGKVCIEAEDQFGNTTLKAFQQKISEASVTRSYCYPNPADTSSRISVDFDVPLGIGDGDSSILKIFDNRGEKVLETTGFSVSGSSMFYDWTLCNDLGYKVSNGTYHFRIILAEKGNTELKGKITVLR